MGFCWGNQGDAYFCVSLRRYIIPAALYDCKRFRRSWKRRHIFETINNMAPGLNLPCSATSGPNFSSEWRSWRKPNDIKKNNKTKQKNNCQYFASILGASSPSLLWLGPSSHPHCCCWLFHVRRPMRVSLADKKEWRTNTTGFGPEWRSNTWRMEGGRKWGRKGGEKQQ